MTRFDRGDTVAKYSCRKLNCCETYSMITLVVFAQDYESSEASNSIQARLLFVFEGWMVKKMVIIIQQSYGFLFCN